MTNYKNGRVYRIEYLENPDIRYIGSTFNRLSDRFTNHKRCFKQYLNNIKGDNNLSIYPYFEKYGIDNFKIVLIKEYKVVDRKHLLMYEQLWMNKIKNINYQSPFQILHKERNKQYYQNNKEYIKQRVKNYADNNKDLIKETNKIYREKNKEEIKKKKSESFNCECGGSWSKGHGFSRHEKTQKHQNYLNSL